MSELVEFIRGCLDADEQTARAAGVGEWVADGREVLRASSLQVLEVVTSGTRFDGGAESPEIATHIARHDPARVLAEVNAKRAILDLHHSFTVVPVDAQSSWEEFEACNVCNGDYPDDWPCETIRLLAQPHAGEPGWRDEWGTQ